MLSNGFVFVELYVEDPSYYAGLFCKALGFRILRDEDDFMELRSDKAVVLLNAFADLEESHPFSDFRGQRRRGLGVEIGVVVSDLQAARAAALEVAGCEVSDIVEQDWGMTDFRIVTPHGYYIRVTLPRQDS